MAWSSSPPRKIDLDNLNQDASAKIYSSLKPSHVRTLRILPTNQSSLEEVECVLDEVDLSKSPMYKALSYTWGSKDNPGLIKLDGEEYLVTQNLLIALQHLRMMGFKDAIWIDAVCINQVDTPERDSQVRQMPRIYEQADIVLLWLGPEADASSQLFETIHEGSAKKFSSEWIAELYRTSTQKGRNTVFDSLMELLMREFWHRLWIVQEIAWAREVIICCGLARMPYLTLLNFLQALKHQDVEESMVHTQTGRIIRLYLGAIGPVGLKDPGSARSMDVFEDPAFMLARNATSKKCFDARDRIYGCHGMFSPALRKAISIDYSLGPGEVILTATRAIIETTLRLEIVLLKRRNEDTPHLDPWEKDLPSWIPELDDKFGQREIFHEALNPKHRSSACGANNAKCSFSPDGHLLEVSGVIIGHIDYLHERNYRPGDHMYGEEHEQVDLIKYIFGFRQVFGDKVHSKQELIAFWSALLGNFMESHLVYEAPRDQESKSEVYRAATDVSQSIVNFAVEMQDLNKLVEERGGLTGWLQSALRIPIFNKHQKAFIEPVYRHFDYRSFFCFQRAVPDIHQTVPPTISEGLRSVDIGVGPVAAKQGDVLCVLYGCKVPVILRPTGSRFKVIGDAHLSDFMNGEALNGSEQIRNFCLE